MSQRIARSDTELPGREENQLKSRTRQDNVSPSAITLPVPDQRQMTSCSGTIDAADERHSNVVSRIHLAKLSDIIFFGNIYPKW